MFKSIHLSHTASQLALLVPRYFSSVEERASVCCFLLVHETAPVPRLKTYLEVEFLSSTIFFQSESMNPTSLGSLFLCTKCSLLCCSPMFYIWCCHESRNATHNIPQIKCSGCKKYKASHWLQVC